LKDNSFPFSLLFYSSDDNKSANKVTRNAWVAQAITEALPAQEILFGLAHWASDLQVIPFRDTDVVDVDPDFFAGEEPELDSKPGKPIRTNIKTIRHINNPFCVGHVIGIESSFRPMSDPIASSRSNTYSSSGEAASILLQFDIFVDQLPLEVGARIFPLLAHLHWRVAFKLPLPISNTDPQSPSIQTPAPDAFNPGSCGVVGCPRCIGQGSFQLGAILARNTTVSKF